MESGCIKSSVSVQSESSEDADSHECGFVPGAGSESGGVVPGSEAWKHETGSEGDEHLTKTAHGLREHKTTAQTADIAVESSPDASRRARRLTTYTRWQHKYRQLKRYARELIYLNAAYCDEVVTTEEEIAKALQQTRYLVARLSYRQRVSEMEFQTGATNNPNPSRNSPHTGKHTAHTGPPKQSIPRHSTSPHPTKQNAPPFKHSGPNPPKLNNPRHQSLNSSKQGSRQKEFHQASGKQGSASVVPTPGDRKTKKKMAATKFTKQDENPKASGKKVKTSGSKSKKPPSGGKQTAISEQTQSVAHGGKPLSSNLPLSGSEGLEVPGPELLRGKKRQPDDLNIATHLSTENLAANTDRLGKGVSEETSVGGFPVDLEVVEGFLSETNKIEKSMRSTQWKQSLADRVGVGKVGKHVEKRSSKKSTPRLRKQGSGKQSKTTSITGSNTEEPRVSSRMSRSKTEKSGFKKEEASLVVTSDSAVELAREHSGQASLAHLHTVGDLLKSDHVPSSEQLPQPALPVLSGEKNSADQVIEQVDSTGLILHSSGSIMPIDSSHIDLRFSIPLIGLQPQTLSVLPQIERRPPSQSTGQTPPPQMPSGDLPPHGSTSDGPNSPVDGSRQAKRFKSNSDSSGETESFNSNDQTCHKEEELIQN